MLELVGLAEEKRRIRGFSRGMKQRLGIAQALLNRPKLLICDEPTSALDPVGRKEILDILQAAREQTTVLFSTHILSDVERICTDVAVLHEGEIVIRGPLSEVGASRLAEGFLVEVECEEDAKSILQAFAGCRLEEGKRLVFEDYEKNMFSVMEFITEQKIPIVRMERLEPSLESLFLEVVEK